MFSALTFASPVMLAALAALPAIWLLLRATPPAPQRVAFPAFVILRQLQSREETPAKTPWPLLLLRLLLAAFVIVGLAGPILNAPKASLTTAPLVFVVDDTWAAAPGWRDRQTALKSGAEEAAASGRALYILTTADVKAAPALSPLTPEEARGIADALRPLPFRADRKAATAALTGFGADKPEVRWLSDGLAGEDDEEFAVALANLGSLSVFVDERTPSLGLRTIAGTGGERRYRAERLAASGAWSGEAVATARDGRELGRAAVAMDAGSPSAEFAIDLPLALRNEVAGVAIEDYPSAGAVQLADARDRRALVGLIAGTDTASEALLSGGYYVRKALEPFAEFIADTLDNLLASDVSVIVLDDVGRMRPGDVEALDAFLEKGGVVIRFAGPNLADASQDADPPLLPVTLRGGGRAFGGALTWETPQRLGAYAPQGPFGDLGSADDVFVRQQVLATPGGETSERTWASLADGTPIVTGIRKGAGALALFHVPATPGWSDLPLSGAFVEMLRKLTYLSVLGPERADAAAAAGLAPLRTLDAFGRFAPAAADAPSIRASEAALAAAPGRPPGFYGAPEAPIAVNALAPGDAFAPLVVAGARTQAYLAEPPVRLSAPLFAAALLLLALDAMATLIIGGRLRLPRPTRAAASLSIVALFLAAVPADAIAQGPQAAQDTVIDAKASEAALKTRLAFVRTGDPEIDRLSERGLSALALELIRRTAVEPDPPDAVDPETDDLSIYPMLYWPIAAGARPPSERALANIENFMRFGGLIVFDTRDDERAVAGTETPERRALKEILGQIDVPPLIPLPDDHVLTRSFYLLDDLEGRMRNNPVFVQSEGAANDGVTPLIIGGRDWAGAWAADDFGRPLRPMARGGEAAREFSYRAGINIVMVAYTGNYKADLVHTPILLERLGR